MEVLPLEVCLHHCLGDRYRRDEDSECLECVALGSCCRRCRCHCSFVVNVVVVVVVVAIVDVHYMMMVVIMVGSVTPGLSPM